MADLDKLEQELNEVVDGNVTVTKEGENVKITIEQLNGSGEGEEVTVLDVEETAEAINEILNTRAESLYKAWLESYTDDEEILEYWLLELGGDQIGSDRLEEVLKGVSNDDRASIDILYDLAADTDKIFPKKKAEIEQRRIQKETEYGL